MSGLILPKDNKSTKKASLLKVEFAILPQNKMLRLLNNKKRSQVLANNLNILSVNQLNAQIKITEMWKAIKVSNYPLKFKNSNTNDSVMVSRSKIEGKLLVKHGSDNLKSTFKNDGIEMWNSTPDIIKDCKNLDSAKKQYYIIC